MAGAAVNSLQQRLEESKRSAKEKDGLAARLKSRVRQLEEAAQKACREADDKEARREREYKMLQDVSLRESIKIKYHVKSSSKLLIELTAGLISRNESH